MRTDVEAFQLDPKTKKPNQIGVTSRVALPKLDGFELEPGSGKSPNQIGGASKGFDLLVLYAPRMAKSFALTPTFRWSTQGDSQAYIFRIVTADKTILFEATIRGGLFIYPSAAPALVPGMTYR